MARRWLACGLGAMVALGLAGCSSVEVARDLHGMGLVPETQAVAHVNGESWGIYFLPVVPLLTGSTSSPGRPTVFHDTAKVEPVVSMALMKAQQLGATGVTDLCSSRQSFPVFPPFLLWYKSVQVSGNALK